MRTWMGNANEGGRKREPGKVKVHLGKRGITPTGGVCKTWWEKTHWGWPGK